MVGGVWEERIGERGKREHTLALHPLGSGSAGFFLRALVLPYKTQGHQHPRQPIIHHHISQSSPPRKKEIRGVRSEESLTSPHR